MGDDKRRNEERGETAGRGPLPDAVMAEIAMLVIVIARGHERAAAVIQQLRANRMPGMLASLDRTLDLWVKLDSVPFMLIGAWPGRAEGLYLMARSEQELLKSAVPYAMAYALANDGRCAFMMGTDDALAERLTKAVAIIEGSVWPEGAPTEPVRLDEAEFDEPFATAVSNVLRNYEASMQSATAAQRASRQLLEPLVMRRGDGWFQFQAQHADGREARLMVPPTHWRFRGGPPPIAKRTLD
jgi:hypothetical protein